MKGIASYSYIQWVETLFALFMFVNVCMHCIWLEAIFEFVPPFVILFLNSIFSEIYIWSKICWPFSWPCIPWNDKNGTICCAKNVLTHTIFVERFWTEFYAQGWFKKFSMFAFSPYRQWQGLSEKLYYFFFNPSVRVLQLIVASGYLETCYIHNMFILLVLCIILIRLEMKGIASNSYLKGVETLFALFMFVNVCMHMAEGNIWICSPICNIVSEFNI